MALLSGMPAGVAVDLEFVNHELWRRQQGYGRGGRMRIERDTARILSGVRHGKTIGSPIALLLANNDWQNWTEALPVEEGDPAKHKRVARRAQVMPTWRVREVQLLRSALCSGAGLGSRVGGARGRRRHCQAAAARDRHRGFQPRHRCGSGAAGEAGDLGRDSPVAAKEEVLLGCIDAEAEARMKEQVDHRAAYRRFGGRRLRGRGAQCSARAWHLRQLGRAPGCATGRRGDVVAGGKGAWRLATPSLPRLPSDRPCMMK